MRFALQPRRDELSGLRREQRICRADSQPHRQSGAQTAGGLHCINNHTARATYTASGEVPS